MDPSKRALQLDLRRKVRGSERCILTPLVVCIVSLWLVCSLLENIIAPRLCGGVSVSFHGENDDTNCFSRTLEVKKG
jgi:hypothetical protein